jgi:hypothetical protein
VQPPLAFLDRSGSNDSSRSRGHLERHGSDLGQHRLGASAVAGVAAVAALGGALVSGRADSSAFLASPAIPMNRHTLRVGFWRGGSSPVNAIYVVGGVFQSVSDLEGRFLPRQDFALLTWGLASLSVDLLSLTGGVRFAGGVRRVFSQVSCWWSRVRRPAEGRSVICW